MRSFPIAFATLGMVLASFGCRSKGGSGSDAGALSQSARIDETTARSAALSKVPGGKVIKEELEQENGRLVYSFDIKKGAEPGIEEVVVDANDGSVVSVQHEDAAAEAKEMKADSAGH
jgi:uncharacterized membrane protein YkoI